MGLHRRHQTENQALPIVDLEGCEIKNDPTDIRVKLMEMHDPADGERAAPFMDNGDIIVLNMDMFPGSSSDAETFIDGLRAKAHSLGYTVIGCRNTYVLAPNQVTVKKV